MTDLDLTPAGLRKLAQECVTPDTSAFAVLLECCRTLRALADQIDDWRPTDFDNPPGNWTEKAVSGAVVVAAHPQPRTRGGLTMTHQTIKAIASRIGIINASEDYAWIEEAKAAARVILEAEPSEAEVEAAYNAPIPGGSEAYWWFNPHENEKAKANIKDVVRRMLKAANAAKAKETGL